MKINRLLEISLLLLGKGNTTAGELIENIVHTYYYIIEILIFINDRLNGYQVYLPENLTSG